MPVRRGECRPARQRTGTATSSIGGTEFPPRELRQLKSRCKAGASPGGSGPEPWAIFSHRPPTPGCACSWRARLRWLPAAFCSPSGFAHSDWVTGAQHPSSGTAGAVQPPSPRGELGIDCRYCHTSVAEGPRAGLPPTHTCMTCHSQIWTGAPMLAPVRESLAETCSLNWNRVARAARLCVLPPRHPHRQGRRLRRMPRPCRQDGADRARQAADHAVLPRLPPRSGAASAAARSDHQHGLEARAATARRRATRCSQQYGIRVGEITHCSVCHR